jgi:hypothetical protein
MLGLLRVTLLMALLHSLVLVGVRVVGANQRLAASALFFDAAGARCQPACLLGIRAGITRFDDALRHLEQHPLTAHLTRFTLKNSVWFEGPDVRLSLSRGGDQRVAMIKLERLTAPDVAFTSTNPLVVASRGDLTAVLGAPDAIQLGRVQLSYSAFEAAITYTLYADWHAEIIHWQRRWWVMDTGDSFMQIALYAERPVRRRKMSAWHGFSLSRQYTQLTEAP